MASFVDLIRGLVDDGEELKASARFRLGKLIAKGGMGVVYLAEQREPRRRVALKVIRGSAQTDSLHVRLFRREAETLGRLRHPDVRHRRQGQEREGRGLPYRR